MTADAAGPSDTADPRTLLATATRRLAQAGVPSPRVDAELLLAALLDVPRGKLVTLDRVPTHVAGAYDEHVTRRAGREPLQHITGRAPFRHLLLAVGPGVFVPRPETELLVDAVLPGLRGRAVPFVVDLCSGSGALALAVADEVPGATVVAIERSPGAAAWLDRNAEGTGVQVIVGDVRDAGLLQPFAGRADAVVANPPYVPSGTEVDPEVQADPHDAVFAGPDGLGLMPAIVDAAATLLRSGGVLAVEHDDSHGDAVADLVRADARWSAVSSHRDLTGRPRYAVATRA